MHLPHPRFMSTVNIRRELPEARLYANDYQAEAEEVFGANPDYDSEEFNAALKSAEFWSNRFTALHKEVLRREQAYLNRKPKAAPAPKRRTRRGIGSY